MKELEIRLSLTEDIKDFVRIANKYNYDIDLGSDRYVIDAKSILGIFSLDLTKPVHVRIHSNDCDDLLKDLEAYKV